MTAEPPATTRRGVFDAQVLAHRQLHRGIWRLALGLTGPGAVAFAAAGPGQFAELRVDDLSLPPVSAVPEALAATLDRPLLLRRPLSFSRVEETPDGTCVEVTYAVVGPGTARLSGLKPGGRVSILGPLGRGFQVEPGTRRALLVGGGLGIPPVEHLARTLRAERPDVVFGFLAGAQCARGLPLELETTGGRSHLCDGDISVDIATDDGSLGYRGFVTDLLDAALRDLTTEQRRVTQVFACGPEPMLARVAALAARYDVACQVSLERRMACGINLCQGCAVACRAEGDRPSYRMCCQDGPVFKAGDVLWDNGTL